jgi:hypothetical protein
MNYGYVYCATNECMKNLCKIGMTMKNPNKRVYELSSSTNCPKPFILNFYMKINNPLKYEKIIHYKLNNKRINKNREFFNIDCDILLKYFDKDVLISYGGDIDDFPDDYLFINQNKNQNQNKNKNQNQNENENQKQKQKQKLITTIECKKCGKDFPHNYLLLNHSKRKFSCNTEEHINKVFDDKIKNNNKYILDTYNKSVKNGKKCFFL